MQYPLTIERFQEELEFKKIIDRNFLQLFINVLNVTYEIRKESDVQQFLPDSGND